MSNPDYSDPNALATLACQRPKPRRKDCPCPPCQTRLKVFGRTTIGVPEQETLRAAWEVGSG